MAFKPVSNSTQKAQKLGLEEMVKRKTCTSDFGTDLERGEEEQIKKTPSERQEKQREWKKKLDETKKQRGHKLHTPAKTSIPWNNFLRARIVFVTNNF